MMIRHITVCIFLISFQTANCQVFKYPETRKDSVTDIYFTTSVNDPYRWLEDDNSPETAEWVRKQNEVTFNYLAQIPFRDSLRQRMTALWNYPKYTPLMKAGHRYFYFKNDGLQNQPVLYMMPGLNFVPMAYFDPNKLADDGTISIEDLYPSNDGKYLVFKLSKAGSDWNELRIKEAGNMKTLPEVISWVKFSNIAWKDSGFYYSRYPGATSNELTGRNEHHRIFYHRINTSQNEDSLVFKDDENALRNYVAETTHDERFLVISGRQASTGNNIYIQDFSKGNRLVNVVDNFENTFQLIGNTEDELIFLTNYNAPRKRLIKINARNPQKSNWKELIPQQEDILLSAHIADNKIVMHYMKDAASKLYIHNMNGNREAEVPLGNFGTVDEVQSSPSDSLFFFSYTTFTSPAVIYRFNLKNMRLFVQSKPTLPYNPDDYETKQVFYTSKDGTRIPMFLVGKKGIKPGSNQPTLLFGYGGFNISKTAEFKPERMVFLEEGGLFAMPNLRGGGEYGQEWHKAGTKLNKQNVFDDFIAAAEYLIKEKYTSSSKLAISGRSNGGLLTGAVMLQRPELFKAAIPVVGVMDMLRYQKFTIGWAWAADYGTSEKEDEFNALYKYSPLHNIKKGVDYPATLITTADHDDRVVPAHSFKFAATLQEKSKGDQPALIRIDTDSGHGSGKPTAKQIEEQADIFSFIFFHLGMKLSPLN